ncbi:MULTISPECIES: ABC transporter ATP-binding protein [Catenuloplanes]|uniref:Iron complex transport system ATP-binding protein n=1 Tax=Catenuloplanes niger TaxID=587534 RepID=A0AAE3ZZW2_9ACTN|nr:ABC transporter ATP-binding protein [Catenuloplanes niger]MDR7327023.1 iron complex transport system ATP-binding protein [Catenuloplanes niger]
MAEGLHAHEVTLGYGDRAVVRRLSVRVPPGKITVIVGPNACGKSTLLRGLARLLNPSHGQVVLDGRDVHRMSTRAVALRLGILPQQPVAPDGMRVADLVGRGRYPHHGFFDRWSDADDDAVAAALLATGTAELAGRSVDELSGGQRQRVWIAMALAQRTGILLLDEPTTFLDVTHQIEVLDLLTDLNRRDGVTLVLVLHDLNLAARYAHHLIVMKGGDLVAEGAPADVITESTVAEVFGLANRVVPDPVSGTPMVVPIGRYHGGLPPIETPHAPLSAERG